jgi:polyisoprenoid-binding protein YceI
MLPLMLRPQATEGDAMSVTQTPIRSDLPAAGTWTIDPSHSTVQFGVRHMMVSKVRGRFGNFEGTINIGEDPLLSSVKVTIDAASIDTRDAKRDEHLRSADFFDVEHYPTLEFASRKVHDQGAGNYLVEGDLTIRGVTRRVELQVEYLGVAQDPWGGTRAGFEAKTEISRKDFGLEWNLALETGGFVLGDKVQIELGVEAVAAQ